MSAPEAACAQHGCVAQLRNRPIGRSRCVAAARRAMHEKSGRTLGCRFPARQQRLERRSPGPPTTPDVPVAAGRGGVLLVISGGGSSTPVSGLARARRARRRRPRDPRSRTRPHASGPTSRLDGTPVQLPFETQDVTTCLAARWEGRVTPKELDPVGAIRAARQCARGDPSSR